MFESTGFGATDAFTWGDLSQLLLWVLAGFLIGVGVKRYGRNILLILGGFFLVLSLLDYYNSASVSWNMVQQSFSPLLTSLNDGLIYLAQNLLAGTVFIIGFVAAVRDSFKPGGGGK
ncbi:MAG: FUN14 domain-containing protein [Deinococcota bacterium]